MVVTGNGRYPLIYWPHRPYLSSRKSHFVFSARFFSVRKIYRTGLQKWQGSDRSLSVSAFQLFLKKDFVTSQQANSERFLGCRKIRKFTAFLSPPGPSPSPYQNFQGVFKTWTVGHSTNQLPNGSGFLYTVTVILDCCESQGTNFLVIQSSNCC